MMMPKTISSTIAGGPQPREEAEHQRGGEPRRDDNQQVCEVDGGHARK
jgi:hypothetical protein